MERRNNTKCAFPSCFLIQLWRCCRINAWPWVTLKLKIECGMREMFTLCTCAQNDKWIVWECAIQRYNAISRSVSSSEIADPPQKREKTRIFIDLRGVLLPLQTFGCKKTKRICHLVTRHRLMTAVCYTGEWPSSWRATEDWGRTYKKTISEKINKSHILINDYIFYIWYSILLF